MHFQYARFQQVRVLQSKLDTFDSSVAARAAFIANMLFEENGHGEASASESRDGRSN
jgi:hypothetical protein